MDKLEYVVEAQDNEGLYQRAFRGVTWWWKEIFNTEPAYIEVIADDAGMLHNRLVLEIDGIRVHARREFSHWMGIGPNPWDIAESRIFRYTTSSCLDLNKYNVAKWLPRRRRRLMKRNAYCKLTPGKDY